MVISCVALEMQCPGLGMAVEVFGDNGTSVPDGMQGELVCTMSFPSCPTSFLSDPDGSKFNGAYFEQNPGIWTHGDWIMRTPGSGT